MTGEKKRALVGASAHARRRAFPDPKQKAPPSTQSPRNRPLTERVKPRVDTHEPGSLPAGEVTMITESGYRREGLEGP